MDLHLRTGALEGVLPYETPQGMFVHPMAMTVAMNDPLSHAVVYSSSPRGIAHIHRAVASPSEVAGICKHAASSPHVQCKVDLGLSDPWTAV